MRKLKLPNEAAYRLRRVIEEYESDTFSASGAEMNDREINHIVAELIDQIEDHIDGVRLTAILEGIRE